MTRIARVLLTATLTLLWFSGIARVEPPTDKQTKTSQCCCENGTAKTKAPADVQKGGYILPSCCDDADCCKHCCPLCAKKMSVQKMENQSVNALHIGSACGICINKEGQDYVTQPLIGSEPGYYFLRPFKDLDFPTLSEREKISAACGPQCCPLCAKKASPQIITSDNPYACTSGIDFTSRPQPESNYVSQPLLSKIPYKDRLFKNTSSAESRPAWEIFAAEPTSENKLTYVGDRIGSRIPRTSITIGSDSDAAITFTAREGRVIVHGQHLRGSANRAYGEHSRDKIVLEGNVHLEYYKQNQRADVEAGRIVLDLSDGSMEIRPGAEPTLDFVKTALFGPWAN